MSRPKFAAKRTATYGREWKEVQLPYDSTGRLNTSVASLSVLTHSRGFNAVQQDRITTLMERKRKSVPKMSTDVTWMKSSSGLEYA